MRTLLLVILAHFCSCTCREQLHKDSQITSVGKIEAKSDPVLPIKQDAFSPESSYVSWAISDNLTLTMGEIEILSDYEPDDTGTSASDLSPDITNQNDDTNPSSH